MNHLKKIASSILAFIIALAPTNVYATEIEIPNDAANLLLSNGYNADVRLSLDNCDTTFKLNSFYLTDLGINNSDEEQGDDLLSVLADTENTPPVADLSYMVANQDTLIDGNFTTDTIIYWLWSNGTTDYTYDPDGDEITGRFLGGINEYVLGNVTIGDKIVGFATKFDVAAQHELIYYVQDENGAYSNILRYAFSVEPADGNKRPVCLISVDNTTPIVGQKVKFSWSRSYDPDGDSLSSVRAHVCDSDGNEELVGGSSKYFVGMGDSCVYLKFDKIGKYTIRIEIGDTNNNWSNWNTSTVEVREALVLKNVEWTSDDYNIDEGFKWGDYAQSVKYAKEDIYSAEDVFAMTTVDRKPACFANKYVLGVNWKVSGQVVTESGIPAPYENVIITVPMSIGEFETKVTTNSNGYFSYTCNKGLWYGGWPESDRPSVASSGITSDWCVYGNKNTTTWLYGTKLLVSCDYSQKSFEVVATTGSALRTVLGDRWVRDEDGWSSAY